MRWSHSSTSYLSGSDFLKQNFKIFSAAKYFCELNIQWWEIKWQKLIFAWQKREFDWINVCLREATMYFSPDTAWDQYFGLPNGVSVRDGLTVVKNHIHRRITRQKKWGSILGKLPLPKRPKIILHFLKNVGKNQKKIGNWN